MQLSQLSADDFAELDRVLEAVEQSAKLEGMSGPLADNTNIRASVCSPMNTSCAPIPASDVTSVGTAAAARHSWQNGVMGCKAVAVPLSASDLPSQHDKGPTLRGVGPGFPVQNAATGISVTDRNFCIPASTSTNPVCGLPHSNDYSDSPKLRPAKRQTVGPGSSSSSMTPRSVATPQQEQQLQPCPRNLHDGSQQPNQGCGDTWAQPTATVNHTNHNHQQNYQDAWQHPPPPQLPVHSQQHYGHYHPLYTGHHQSLHQHQHHRSSCQLNHYRHPQGSHHQDRKQAGPQSYPNHDPCSAAHPLLPQEPHPEQAPQPPPPPPQQQPQQMHWSTSDLAREDGEGEMKGRSLLGEVLQVHAIKKEGRPVPEEPCGAYILQQPQPQPQPQPLPQSVLQQQPHPQKQRRHGGPVSVPCPLSGGGGGGQPEASRVPLVPPGRGPASLRDTPRPPGWGPSDGGRHYHHQQQQQPPRGGPATRKRPSGHMHYRPGQPEDQEAQNLRAWPGPWGGSSGLGLGLCVPPPPPAALHHLGVVQQQQQQGSAAASAGRVLTSDQVAQGPPPLPQQQQQQQKRHTEQEERQQQQQDCQRQEQQQGHMFQHGQQLQERCGRQHQLPAAAAAAQEQSLQEQQPHPWGHPPCWQQHHRPLHAQHNEQPPQQHDSSQHHHHHHCQEQHNLHCPQPRQNPRQGSHDASAADNYMKCAAQAACGALSTSIPPSAPPRPLHHPPLPGLLPPPPQAAQPLLTAASLEALPMSMPIPIPIQSAAHVPPPSLRLPPQPLLPSAVITIAQPPMRPPPLGVALTAASTSERKENPSLRPHVPPRVPTTATIPDDLLALGARAAGGGDGGGATTERSNGSGCGGCGDDRKYGDGKTDGGNGGGNNEQSGGLPQQRRSCNAGGGSGGGILLENPTCRVGIPREAAAAASIDKGTSEWAVLGADGGGGDPNVNLAGSGASGGPPATAPASPAVAAAAAAVASPGNLAQDGDAGSSSNGRGRGDASSSGGSSSSSVVCGHGGGGCGVISTGGGGAGGSLRRLPASLSVGRVAAAATAIAVAPAMAGPVSAAVKAPVDIAAAATHTGVCGAGPSRVGGLPSIAEVRASKAAAAAGGVQRPGAQPPVLEFEGSIRYATTAVEVDWLCGQLEAVRPAVIGLDMEWRPQYIAGAPGNPTALLQICYATSGPPGGAHPGLRGPASGAGTGGGSLSAGGSGASGVCRGGDAPLGASTAGGSGSGDDTGGDTAAAAAAAADSNRGRHCCCLLLHIRYSGVTPRLRALLEAELPCKVGVNITGDANKLKRDYGVEMRGLLELDGLANERVLQHVEHVTTNTEYRSRWSLAALVATVLKRHLPKPNSLRCGNWERRPLDAAQKRYGALDAYAGLAVWAALSRLPYRKAPAPLTVPPAAAAMAAKGEAAVIGGGSSSSSAAAAAATTAIAPAAVFEDVVHADACAR